MEPFVLVVAHHHDDVGIDLGSLLGEPIHGAVIALKVLLPHLEARFLLEVPLAAPGFDQLRKRVDASAERMLGVSTEPSTDLSEPEPSSDDPAPLSDTVSGSSDLLEGNQLC